MLIPNHPEEQRLAALASHETEATADDGLTSHVASCERCARIIDELGAVRTALAELPDLAPSRPLRLLPPVEAAPTPATGGFAGWARRFFAPVLASGAALALVGVIGTAGPAIGPQAQSAASNEPAAAEQFAAPAAAPSQDMSRDSLYGAGEAEAPLQPLTSSGDGAVTGAAASAEAEERTLEETSAGDDAVAERLTTESGSPWPIVLVAGVGIMVGALVMRWLTEPRPA